MTRWIKPIVPLQFAVLLLCTNIYAQEAMNDIINYAQLTQRIATSGQPSIEQFQRIKDEGYDVVINLMTPGSEYGVADEANIVANHGMSYFNIPVVYQDPTLDDLKLFIKTMRAVEDKKVWVHCALNARVSAFMYHYLRHEEGRDEAASRSPRLDELQPRMPDVWDTFLSYSKKDIGLW
jgi:protein tyrosine phosphatase (PTP) superfamily phosphohydrolase (DUF442 family)